MTAEHWAEQAILHPAYKEFLELWVLGRRAAAFGVVGTAEETADIRVEVGVTCQRVAQSGRHLLAQHVP